MTIELLNSLDRERFVRAIGWVFENSPWVAERVWIKRPFASLDALHAAMVDEVEAAGREVQLALIRAHPDLGTRARVSDASAAEQGGVGLNRLSAEEFGQLQQLNSDYRNKFGFPFLFAVKGRTQDVVLRALNQRLGSGREEEFAEALRQVYRIARFRLEDTLVITAP